MAVGQHTPVMVDEALAWLAPRPGGVYCDATVGYAGHAERVLAASAPDGRLVGIDHDEAALAAARARLERFGDRATLVHGAFAEARAILAAVGALPCDGLLCDLGLCVMEPAELSPAYERAVARVLAGAAEPRG